MVYARGATLVAIGVALGAAGHVSAAAFDENFNDGAAGSRWSTAVQLESTRDPTTVADGNVNFAFDYSSLGIANPNGGPDTIGAYIQVNQTDQAGDEGETYVIFPNSYTLPSTGYWRLDADMFVYNDDGLSGGGTTELGMAGAYLNPSAPVAPYQWGSEGGPLAWIYTGEGGSTADLASFKEGTASTTGYAVIDDYNNIPAGTIPGFQTGAAGSLGPSGSNVNGSWVDVTLEKVDNTISWYLNGALIDSYDNTGGFYSDGTIFLGTTDPFNSSNSGGGAVIDNVVVTVPEPTSMALFAVGGLGLLGRRRQR